MKLHQDLDEDCVGRGFVDHDWITFGQCEGRFGYYAGAAAPELLGLVATWMKTMRAEGSSTMTGSTSGNTEFRPSCYAGAAALEQVVCVVAFGNLRRVGDGSSRLCGFLALFST